MWCAPMSLGRNRALLGLMLIGLCLVCRHARGDDWPQWRGPNRDGVWHETGIIEKFAEPEIEIAWRAPVASGYGSPTVVDGRVYVTDRIVDGTTQFERIHCFEAAKGYELWLRSYPVVYEVASHDAGPRGSVAVDSGRVYAFGTMGHLLCLDAVRGDILWQRDTVSEYKVEIPKWGLSSSPLVHGNVVIVQVGGADGACIVAFNTRNGQEVWRAVRDKASYSSPILIEQAGKEVFVCWTGEHVVGLNPTTGEVYWDYLEKPSKFVRHCASPVWDGNRLIMSSFFDGTFALKLAKDRLAIEKDWHQIGEGAEPGKTAGIHANIAEPMILGSHVYGVDSYGEVRCLDINTGKRVWESVGKIIPHHRWSTMRFVRNGDRYWLFTEAGELVIGRFSPEGFEEISRAKLLKPTHAQHPRSRTGVCWSHPAFANQHVYARNDEELVCASLKADS